MDTRDKVQCRAQEGSLMDDKFHTHNNAIIDKYIKKKKKPPCQVIDFTTRRVYKPEEYVRLKAKETTKK